MNKLPLRIVAHEDEDVFSIAARLALRNGEGGSSLICRLLGTLSLEHLGNSAPLTVLSRLSDISGCPIDLLTQNSLQTDGSSVWVRGRKLSTSSFGPLLVRPGRICPICLADDLNHNEDEIECRPYRRLAWRLRPLHTCREHRAMLLTHCPNCETRNSSISLNVRFCSCGYDLSRANTQLVDERNLRSEKYIFERIFCSENAEEHWLFNRIAPAEAELALTQIGMIIFDVNKKKKLMDLTPAERIEVASLGFEVTSSKANFIEFLDRVAKKPLSPKTGPHSIYGRLYRWLYADDNSAFEPIRDLISQHFEHSQKATGSVRLFYRDVENARVISVGTAAAECGCSVERFNSLAESFGHRPQDRTHRSERIERQVVEKVKDLIKSSIDADEAAQRLGISRDVKKAFLNSSRFSMEQSYAGSHRLMRRPEVELLETFFDNTRKVFTELPHEYNTICIAAQRAFVKVPQIAERLIDGELPSIGTLAGVSGLPGVIVNMNDVRNIIQPLETEYLVSGEALKALGLSEFRQLNAAEEAGLITVHTETNNRGRPLIAVTREDAKRFVNDYVLVSNFKNEGHDLHARILRGIRSGDIVPPVNDPKFRIVERAAVEKFLKASVPRPMNCAALVKDPNAREHGAMRTTKKRAQAYPVELRERAVRMVREHAGNHASEWAAMRSVAEKVGCTPEAVRLWVRQAERDRG